MITIHGGAVSPFVRKTRVFCQQKGIPFETTELRAYSDAVHARPSFKALTEAIAAAG